MVQSTVGGAAPGRPREIESFTNLYLIHPVSRWLVGRLMVTPVTPNQVSVASVLAAAGAAYGIWAFSGPWRALVALICLYAWHVLDGADGDLARRTGRASPRGELIDGVCDHASQLLVYFGLTLVLQRALGPVVWLVAVLAGASHFIQSNAYETGRKTYRHWVYGAAWMRQTADAVGADGAVARGLSGLYMALSRLADPGESRVTAAMGVALAGNADAAARARAAYAEIYAPLVKTSGVLDGNTRTMVVVASLLVGDPLWFFLFEILAQNLALIVLAGLRGRCDRRLIAALGA